MATDTKQVVKDGMKFTITMNDDSVFIMIGMHPTHTYETVNGDPYTPTLLQSIAAIEICASQCGIMF